MCIKYFFLWTHSKTDVTKNWEIHEIVTYIAKRFWWCTKTSGKNAQSSLFYENILTKKPNAYFTYMSKHKKKIGPKFTLTLYFAMS